MRGPDGTAADHVDNVGGRLLLHGGIDCSGYRTGLRRTAYREDAIDDRRLTIEQQKSKHDLKFATSRRRG